MVLFYEGDFEDLIFNKYSGIYTIFTSNVKEKINIKLVPGNWGFGIDDNKELLKSKEYVLSNFVIKSKTNNKVYDKIKNIFIVVR